jgi:phospho-N-acetylmuramoyl-pentapeptide-transferase
LQLQAIAAYLATSFHPDPLQYQIALPVFKNLLVNFSFLFLPFAMLVIVGSANAVNLTDGLDGLAIMPAMIAAGALGVIAYAVGRVDFTTYLDVHYVPGTGEILIFCAGLIGGGMGFLWYNAPPAAVFMGDTGSLALGGALGSIAVITKHEIVWAIIGGLFVLEALSGDHSGLVVQTHGSAGVLNGAHSSSLRKKRMGRANNRDPVLDYCTDSCDDWFGDLKGALTPLPGACSRGGCPVF